MLKTARTIFILGGIILPIFIGSLHTYTHFNDLITSEVQQLLSSKIPINGQEQTLWNTWGIMSFMMGASFIIIGLLNLSTIRGITKADYPPVISLVAMISYQLCVTYVGYEFEQSVQLYGGISGEVLLLISLFLTLKGRL